MQDFSAAFALAASLIIGADADLIEIIGLSLRVSLAAVLFAALIGFPLGALTAVTRFPGRQLVAVVLNALMGLLSDRLTRRILELELDHDTKMRTILAFNKLLWIQNDLVHRHYHANSCAS